MFGRRSSSRHLRFEGESRIRGQARVYQVRAEIALFGVAIFMLAFVVVVLGGAGSLAGAFTVQRIDTSHLAVAVPVAPTFAEFTMMGLVVLTLAWRPNGIFGWAGR